MQIATSMVRMTKKADLGWKKEGITGENNKNLSAVGSAGFFSLACCPSWSDFIWISSNQTAHLSRLRGRY
jgi:hypothetical protein